MSGYKTNSKDVVALTSPLHYLTEQQKIYVQQIMHGKSPGIAARIAGYSNPDQQGYAVIKSAKVAAAVKYLHQKHEKAADMNRKKVMDGFLEAIEMAKLQADSGNMIAGWREIGRMCGYYAPEVKKIDVTITGKRAIDVLETLTDDALLQMVAESQNIIEAGAADVLEQLQLEAPNDGTTQEN